MEKNNAILEKVVFKQFYQYVITNNMHKEFHSGFCYNHNAVVNKLQLSAGSNKVSVLLYLSVAFDTIDHKILIDCLENWIDLSGTVLK